MKWLDSLLGRKAGAVRGQGPSPDAENPIHAWLDATGIPWREDREVLMARYGVAMHTGYQWEVIEIDPPSPPLSGLIGPFSAQAFDLFSPHYPATEFSALTYFGPDERENVRRTRDELAKSLGPMPIVNHWNTVRCTWSFGEASLRLMAFPRDMQSLPTGSNPAHQRDPRLALGCQIYIHTGLFPALSSREDAWLRSFTPIAGLPPQPLMEGIDQTGPVQSEMEFLRDPRGVEGVRGSVGLSADGQGFIFQDGRLHVIAIDDVLGFRVSRMLPAKGSGGSTLSVTCRTHYDGRSSKSLTLCRAPGPDDLSDLGAVLARATDRPLDLGEYDYDC